jgi:hypothetical protein
MAEIVARTEHWCDILSLSPPDGLFMEKMQDAIATIAERAKSSKKKITIRLLVGNIVGMPVNCTAVLKKLTAKIPPDANIRMWVGAWRKGVSWNHAKLIAVDGLYLHTGERVQNFRPAEILCCPSKTARLFVVAYLSSSTLCPKLRWAQYVGLSLLETSSDS